jgi:hypothetical protein
VKINLTIVKGDMADLQKAMKRIGPVTRDRINKLTDNVLREAENTARDLAPYNVGTLKKGIRREILANMGRGNTVTGKLVSQAEYSTAVEFGRTPGTWPDIKAIQWWVKRKKIAGTYSIKTRRRTGNKQTKEQQDKQVAFLIGRKIYNKGIDPKPFMRPSYEQWSKVFEQRLWEELRTMSWL